MHLAQLANSTTPVALSAVAADRELSSDVQDCLVKYGLLDPAVDGSFGGVSNWALEEFCEQKGINIGQGLSSRLARELLNAVAKPLPLSPDLDLAGRIAQAMIQAHYWINRHPKCFNIVYVEGMNVDGMRNDNKPNRFNDCRCLLAINKSGKPVLAGIWKGTTEPSKYWTEHPMDRRGAARIAFGQYKSWSVGMYHNYEVLRQAEDITVYRDLNRDYDRTGDKTYTGMFGIHHHWGYDLPDNDLGHSSAGCLVGQKRAEHKDFMRLVKSDPRYSRGTKAYRFIAAIMPYSALPPALG
jgi:hypothetical protein